jgi:predicted nucleotidyltransferase
MILANNFEEVLKVFNSCDVDYLIAGGYAVIFHGYGRTTGDIDIWISPQPENKERIVRAFEKLVWRPELIDYIRNIDFSKPFAVKVGDEPLQVDIFNAITGINYIEAKNRSIIYKFAGGLEVRFIHLDDLVTNKMLTGRLKDKADVEELQRIRRYKNRL